ncbi:MAG: hypothetical protein M1123_05555 [Candidatus Thermoplasmatota archaeon]|nr:hypothetical protein [Candidatus Thermoplasmatota archaeon]
MSAGHGIAPALGIGASALDLLIAFLTLLFTGGFSTSSFVAAAFYDSSPMFVAGIGIIAGLAIFRRRPEKRLGRVIIIVTGMVPIAVLYDIARTIVIYGSEYITSQLSFVYVALIVVPMIMSVVCGIILSNKR